MIKYIHRQKRASTFVEKWEDDVRVETTVYSRNDARFQMQMQLREGHEVVVQNDMRKAAKES